MSSTLNRRKFLSTGAVVVSGLATGLGVAIPAASYASSPEARVVPAALELKSLSPTELFTVLDLDLPELTAVRNTLKQKGHDAALSALLDYYRERYPKPVVSAKDKSQDKETFKRADDLEKHTFQWGPYPPANYGPDINWAADPVKDIEWIAAVYRFYWSADLAKAYAATGDERYARTFVELTSDWIAKHPLEKSLNEEHPVYGPARGGYWRGYAWLDLQTGIRATNICRDFKAFVNSKTFTPEFLGILLASLYDHQVKTEFLPMGDIHNKAIFEQRGFINVLHTFREFKDKNRWLGIAVKIVHENLLAQTTTDGVQREWCGGYHLGVYRDVLEIDGRVRDLGSTMPPAYRDRVHAMAEHIFSLSTPDLDFPMFGDTSRHRPDSSKRSTWPLYSTLIDAGKEFKEPKYQALADLKLDLLPKNGSAAFKSAGLYTLRNGWSPSQVYMAVHCSPPAISSHDTADNGTFELYAHGRWLMPDSGYFTYGNNPEARAWHRQTKIHPTMTLDGKDTNIQGIHRHWQSDESADQLCVENYSYKYFLHRRTIWFSDKNTAMPFFVILDEAIGDAKGDIAVHFPMAPGEVKVDNANKSISTAFDDANLLIHVYGKHPINLTQEEGWHAWTYGKRERRTSVSAVFNGQGPTVFVSVLVPYQGKTQPECRLLTDPSPLVAGADTAEIAVEVAGKKHTLSRKL